MKSMFPISGTLTSTFSDFSGGEIDFSGLSGGEIDFSDFSGGEIVFLIPVVVKSSF